MSRRIWKILASSILITALALGFGCARADTDDGVAPTPDVIPSDEPVADDDERTPVVAYFVGSEKVLPVRRYASSEAVAYEALDSLLSGVNADEASRGLSTLIPQGTRLLGVSVSGTTATVNLSGEFASGGGSLSMMGRVAQVVFTATQFPTIESVSFELDGVAVDVLGGEGIVLEDPQTRADWEDFSPAVLVESPVRGDSAVLSDPLRVTGSANVFEAQFAVRIVDGSGVQVVDSPVMATSGTGTRGTFDVTFDLPAESAPGAGWIEVGYDSAMDGSWVSVDTVHMVWK